MIAFLGQSLAVPGATVTILVFAVGLLVKSARRPIYRRCACTITPVVLSIRRASVRRWQSGVWDQLSGPLIGGRLMSSR